MTTPVELKTIRDFVRYAISCFNEAALYYGHGTNNAWDEAIALILHTLHLPHDINPTILDANLTDPERQKLYHLIGERVHQRIPVPYLTHQAWFCHMPFYVDERVLIPRSSIGELIENQFSPWIPPEDVTEVLDLCTGSGCIAIACAKYFPHAEIDASDISKEALAVAKINVLKHDVEAQVHLIESNLFINVPQKKYNLIVSNPPYVSPTEIDTLPKEYRHEPLLGLKADENGLKIVIEILNQAQQFLTSEGLLVVEVGNSEEALTELLPDVPFYWPEFENSEGGVFLLTSQQLKEHQSKFSTVYQQMSKMLTT